MFCEVQVDLEIKFIVYFSKRTVNLPDECQQIFAKNKNDIAYWDTQNITIEEMVEKHIEDLIV